MHIGDHQIRQVTTMRLLYSTPSYSLFPRYLTHCVLFLAHIAFTFTYCKTRDHSLEVFLPTLIRSHHPSCASAHNHIDRSLGFKALSTTMKLPLLICLATLGASILLPDPDLGRLPSTHPQQTVQPMTRPHHHRSTSMPSGSKPSATARNCSKP